jgi:hypothetical protein
LNEAREGIRRAFFVDMFQMLNRPEVLARDKTAFEVAQLVQEKLLLFAPFFARITQEKLNVLLERAFALMARGGKFAPPPPEVLQGGEYRITYVSKIALAIKAAQDNALVEMLQLCSLMAPFDQSVPMVIKWREAYKSTARSRGVSPDLIRTEDEIDELVAQAAAAQARQQALAAGESLTKSVSNLGETAQRKATEAIAA